MFREKSIKYYVLSIKGLLRLFVFLLLATYYILHTTSVSAQVPIPTTVSPTSPVYTDLLVHNLFHTFSCLSVGSSVIGQPCLSYQNGIPVLSKVNLQGGALGATTSLIGALYANPPVRTIDYLASVGQGLGIVKEAKAQVIGSGAQVLNPILTLWQVSRNISYVFMIIIFVVIGLMVMFRNRINPQTVITAQAALPGLVIGLILITFSYFLAGLVADTAFVGTNVVGYYFAAAQGKTNDPDRVNLVNKISGDSVLSIFSPLVGIIDHDKASSIMSSIWDKIGSLAQDNLRLLVGILAAQFISPFAGVIPPPWGLIIAPATSILGGGVVATNPPFFLGFAVAFIATLALIYQMLKLLLRLLACYLTIIFLTLSAPFQFLAASLPGRQGIATSWVLNMLGNILVFPAVLAVFYFVAFILGPTVVGANYPLKVSDSSHIDNNSFVSVASAETNGVQITGINTFPLLGGLDLSFVRILLAFGALMALPKIPDIIVSTIGKAGQAGQIIGQEISGGLRSGQGYGSQMQRGGQEQLLSAKTNLVGEHGLIYNPRTGGYEPGLTKAGWFTRNTKVGGPPGAGR